MSTVIQSRFVKGVIATTTDQSQPKGSIPRASNLVFSRRGGLRTCDGSLIISEFNAALAPGSGPWTEIFLFQPVNVNRYYIGIRKDYSVAAQLANPIGLVVADGGAGGVIPAGTYPYVVTALDGAGGETLPSNEVFFVNAGARKASGTWTAVPNAVAYNVYRGSAGGGSGTETFLFTVATNAFTDVGAVAPSVITSPGINSTQTCPFFTIPSPSYTNANKLTTFPADAIVPIDGTPGGTGEGGGSPPGTLPGGGAPPNPQGGNSGNISPLPQIIQFAGKAFLALGNGFSPQVFADNSTAASTPDWTATTQFGLLAIIHPTINNVGGFFYAAVVPGTTGGAAPAPFNQTVGTNTTDGTVSWRNIGLITTFPIFNTFNAAYPDWQTATGYSVGDLIKPSVNNAGGFVFKAIQGGISGGAAPTFPQNTNGTVSDNKVIWQNLGTGVSSPAPRGAAHAVVYAGSLWVLNTNPTTTPDQLDGPNCLKMSDLNNPVSWNPLNVAFLSKDDGDQGTGLLAFTIADAGIVSTSALFAFKNFKTFQVLGVFGSSNFQILEVQTDMGCIAPRSISFVPGFGGMRLTHLGVAVLDGIRDKLISDEVRPYLFGDPNTPDIFPMDMNFAYFSKGAQTANPPMYVLAIPVALNNLPLQADVPPGAQSVLLTMSQSLFPTPPFVFYFRVTRFTLQPDGTTFESDISKQSAFTYTQGSRLLNVVSGNGLADPLALKFRVYAGTQSNSYAAFAELTPAQMQAGISLVVPNTFPGGNFPNSGSPLNGVGGLTRLLCYDLVFKAWTVIDLPFAISVLKQVRAPGTQPITIVGGFSDAAVRRVQGGDVTFDGSAVQWSFRTPEVYSDGAMRRSFYRGVQMRGVAALADAQTIRITPIYSGATSTQPQANMYAFGGNQFHLTADLLVTALNADARVQGQGAVEVDAVAWEVEPEPEGVPMVFG